MEELFELAKFDSYKYFLDYRENPDTIIRWTDRLQSSSGEWSGNSRCAKEENLTRETRV